MTAKSCAIYAISFVDNFHLWDNPNAFEVVPVLVRGGGVDKHLQNSKTFSILDAVPSVCFGFDVLSASSDI